MSLLTLDLIYFMSLNVTFFRTEVVNEDEALRCINKAIEIDEKIKIRKYLKVQY